jgi:hypothetical protein
MASWKSLYGPPIALKVADGEVVLSQPDRAPLRCTKEEFSAGKLNHEVLRALNLRVLVEALAVIKLGEVAVRAAKSLPSVDGRPSPDRNYKGPNNTFVWLLGRTMAASIGPGPRVDLPFDEVAAKGLPSEVRSALGAEVSGQVEQAVRQLSPLPCFCGTGFRNMSDHDGLEVLAEAYDSDAPIDVNGRVVRCTRCGHCWTLNEEGDSHYSYTYDVWPFAPED